MAPRNGAAATAANNDKETKCLGCGKSLSNTHCHQCTLCGLWSHKACSGISDEFFKQLEEQVKNTGVAFWACRPCTNFAQGITRKVRDMHSNIERIDSEVKEVRSDMQSVKSELTSVNNSVKQVVESATKVVEDNNKVIFDELREREARRLNVVLRGVQEHAGDQATGKERQAWDISQCIQICRALDLTYAEEDFKFCRRVGVSEDGPRALILGFYTETEKGMLMRRPKRLPDTRVRVAQDLTQEQIQKNLAWMVVGARGEKRLVLLPRRPEGQQVRQQPRGQPRGRGRPAKGRGAVTRPPPPREQILQQQALIQTIRTGDQEWALRGNHQRSNEEIEVEENDGEQVEQDTAGPTTGAAADTRKRKQPAAGLEGQPAEKR